MRDALALTRVRPWLRDGPARITSACTPPATDPLNGTTRTERPRPSRWRVYGSPRSRQGFPLRFPLRSNPFGADGLDRLAVEPRERIYVMAGRHRQPRERTAPSQSPRLSSNAFVVSCSRPTRSTRTRPLRALRRRERTDGRLKMTKRHMDRFAEDRASRSTAEQRVASQTDRAKSTHGADERRALEALAGYFSILQEWTVKRRSTDQPARAHEQRTHAGDHTISEAEAWRTLPGAIEHQQLLLAEHGSGHHGTHAAGTGEPGDGRQQMQEKGRPDRAPHNPNKIAKSSKTFAN